MFYKGYNNWRVSFLGDMHFMVSRFQRRALRLRLARWARAFERCEFPRRGHLHG